MTMRSIRPVGNPIALTQSDYGVGQDNFANGYKPIFLNSGTAALSLAIQAACGRTRTGEPEVILPAYGCPDLVAAAVDAGAKPVLADLRPNSAEYDPASVASHLQSSTVAIVAVTLLGIRPNFNELRTIIAGRDIALVEDSAQWFPRLSTQTFDGDYVVLSFGRGKPVSLLEGGALLVKKGVEAPIEPKTEVCHRLLRDEIRLALYNLLIHPSVYGLVERMPALKLGQSKYVSLDCISRMCPAARGRLGVNLENFRSRSIDVQDSWRAAIQSLRDSSILDLSVSHRVPRDYSLLRYPLLIDSQGRRDTVYAELRKHGLGGSIMYGRALPDIEGVRERMQCSYDVPIATDFAARLLALPTHIHVDQSIVERTMDILSRRESCGRSTTRSAAEK